MKKRNCIIFSILLSLIVALVIIPSNSLSAIGASLELSGPASVHKGEVYELSLTLETPLDLKSLDLTINYDETVLSYLDLNSEVLTAERGSEGEVNLRPSATVLEEGTIDLGRIRFNSIGQGLSRLSVLRIVAVDSAGISIGVDASQSLLLMVNEVSQTNEVTVTTESIASTYTAESQSITSDSSSEDTDESSSESIQTTSAVESTATITVEESDLATSSASSDETSTESTEAGTSEFEDVTSFIDETTTIVTSESIEDSTEEDGGKIDKRDSNGRIIMVVLVVLIFLAICLLLYILKERIKGKK